MPGPRHLASLLLAVAAVMAAACGGAAPPDSSSPPSPSLPGTTTSAAAEASEHRDVAEVILSRHGGLCPQGGCRYEVVASEEDGTWTASGTGYSPGRGEVAPSAVADLAELIVSRFDELTAEPFSGDCPTAYDGQELAVTVRLLPRGPDAHLRDAQVVHTTSCTHDWPDPLVEEISRRWQEAGMPAVLDAS